jgi:heat shock protein HtpX
VLAGVITRMALYVRMGGRDRDNNAAVVFLAVVVASAIVYALSFLLIRTLSRYRELAADRAGAIVTGRPSALASALVKVSGEMGRIPTRDLRQAEAFNAFFFVPALARGFSLSSLFATHPPLERRLEQLGQLAAQLGGPA